MKYLSILILSLLLVACGDKPEGEGTLEPANSINSGNPTVQDTNTNKNTGKENAPDPNINTDEAYCICTGVGAFVLDPEEGLEHDFYDAPNGKVTGEFKNRLGGMEVMVTINTSKEGWMQIGTAQGLPSLDGKWLEPGLLTGSPRRSGVLYKEQSTDSEVLHSLGIMQPYLGIYGCCRDWIYVKGIDADSNLVEGWMNRDMWCGNPVTSCS